MEAVSLTRSLPMRWITATTLCLILAAALSAQPPDPPRPPGFPPGGPGPGGYGPSDPDGLSKQFKDLIPGLIEALKDTDQEVRQHAAMALAGLGPDALKPLI